MTYANMHRSGFIRVLVLLLAGGSSAEAAAAAAPAAHPNITGVWQAATYQRELRTAGGELPPLTTAAASVYQQHLAAARGNDHTFDATVHQCASPGIPRVLFLPYPFEIMERADQISFLVEWNHLFRGVPVGAASRSEDYSTAMGDAHGEWRDGVLVVRTDNLSATTLLDAAGLPHSEQLVVTESYSLERNGAGLRVQLQFEDPETFTHPWETVLHLNRLPGYRIKEDICLDRLAKGDPAIAAR